MPKLMFRRCVSLVVMPLIAFAGIRAYLLCLPEMARPPEFQLIRPGMTRDEVFGILGWPDDQRGGAWCSSGDDMWGDFRKTGDHMSELSPFCRTFWNRTTYAIDINWENGRVIGATLWRPVPQPGLLSRVWEWILGKVGL
jgi:hypothetical protein